MNNKKDIENKLHKTRKLLSKYIKSNSLVEELFKERKVDFQKEMEQFNKYTNSSTYRNLNK